MIRSNGERSGLTLTEVLVSIFILAIGLMALMSLFPIGALQMAQAMKDDRCGQDAANAERIFRVWWKQNWFNPATGALADPSASQPAIYALTDRNSATLLTAAQTSPNINNYHGGYKPAAGSTPASTIPFTAADPVPSFPVLIDPIGAANNLVLNLNTAEYWVAGTTRPTRFIPRRDMYIPNTPGLAPALVPLSVGNVLQRFRYCALADEFTYDEQGNAGLTNGTGVVKREGTYNHAWLIQRPNSAVPYEANLQVLVFRGRASTDTPNPEHQYGANSGNNTTVTYTANSNIVTLTYPENAKPLIRRGGWIINASQYQVREVSGAAYNYQYIRQLADPYRVVGVTEISATQMDVELQTPVRSVLTTNVVASVNTLITMDNLVEVFDRGTISAFDKPAP